MKPIPSPYDNSVIIALNKAQQLLEKAEKLEMVEHGGKKVPHFAADGKGQKDMKTKASMAEKDKYCMKNFGKKYSECSEKQKAQCDKAHGKVEKGEKCPDCKNNDCPTCKMKKGEKCPDCKNNDCPTCKMEKGEKCPSCGLNKADCMGKMGGCGSMKMKKGFDEGTQPGFSTSFNSNPQGVMFMAESGGQTRNAYYTTNQYPYTGDDIANKGATSESFNMESLSGKLNPHEGGGADRQIVEGHLSKARAMLEAAGKPRRL